jgi:hypothetical protein
MGQQKASDEELATKLNNPVSSLISVPFQFNWDHEYGPDRSGRKFQLNVQPVVPVALTSDWSLIATRRSWNAADCSFPTSSNA